MIQNYKKNKSVQIYNGIFLLFHSFLPFTPIPGTFFHVKSTPSPIPVSGKFIPDHSPFSTHPPNAQAGNVNPTYIVKTLKKRYQRSIASWYQRSSIVVPKVQHSYTKGPA